MQERHWVAQPAGWPARTISTPPRQQPQASASSKSVSTANAHDPLQTPIYTPAGAVRVHTLQCGLTPLYNPNQVPLSEGKIQVKYSAGRTTWASAVADVEKAMLHTFGPQVQ